MDHAHQAATHQPADRPPRTRLLIGALLGLLLLGSMHAAAATYVVDDTTDAPDVNGSDGVCLSTLGTCTLRAAIMQANYTSGKDTVQVPAGTFVLSIAGAGEDSSATGDLDIRHPISVSGAGAEATVIDADGLDRVLHVLATAPGSWIADLSLRGGALTSTEGQNAGGGLLNEGTELLLERVTVEDNHAQGSGGGIASRGDLVVQRSIVRDNSAWHPDGGGSGGGIAMLYPYPKLTLQRTSVVANSSGGNGGGLYVSGGLEARQSTIASNESVNAYGGGVMISSQTQSVYRLENVTLSGNHAYLGGGGLFAWKDASLEHVTITGNGITHPLQDGGGIWVYPGTTTLLENSIVHGNSAPGAGPDCWGPVTSLGGNLIGTTSGCGIALTAADAPAGTDPQLGPLQGQPLPVHPIGATSPARDFVPAPCLLFDALDTPRPQGPACDAGAYEIYVSGYAPVAVDDSYTNQGAGLVSIPAPGVLANDYDPANFPLTALLEFVDPNVGAVTLAPDGGFVFVPANFTTANPAFSYRAAIGAVVSNIATVSIERRLRFEVPVLLEVPEIPWLFPGPYQHDCLALWDDGTLAGQLAAEGAWNARESGWSRGARAVAFEGWVRDYRGGRYTITGRYDGETLEGSVLGPDRRIVPITGRANPSCNALHAERR